MEEKNKYLVYYNNGNIETTSKINFTFIHMIEMGVIKFIFDCNKNKAWIRTQEGLSTEITVSNIEGL